MTPEGLSIATSDNAAPFHHTDSPGVVNHAMMSIGRTLYRPEVKAEDVEYDDAAAADGTAPPVPPRSMLCRRDLPECYDIATPSVCSFDDELLDETRPSAYMLKRRNVKKPSTAKNYTYLNTEHGYYRRTKCSPVLVDEVLMPALPCTSDFPDLVFFGIDHGANHCFCGQSWLIETQSKLGSFGLQAIWIDKNSGTMASAGSDSARTIGRVRVPSIFQSVTGEDCNSRFLDMTVLENPTVPCLLGLATMFKFGFNVQLFPEPRKYQWRHLTCFTIYHSGTPSLQR